jgi:hypothetical protein
LLAFMVVLLSHGKDHGIPATPALLSRPQARLVATLRRS